MNTFDRLRVRLLLLSSLSAILLMVLAGCDQEFKPDIFDPNAVGSPTPTITSVSPDTAFGGITSITIGGTNFSPTAEENNVYFDGVKGTIQQVTTTQLRVLPPIVEKDSVRVKVSVKGAEAFSNTAICFLRLASKPLGGISVADAPWAIACDDTGNYYVSILTSGIGVGIKKFATNGTVSSFAPKGFETKYSTLRFGPDKRLYGSWNIRAISVVPAPNTSPALFVTLSPTTTKIYTFDFDADGNIWAGGDNPVIFRIKPDKSVKTFPLVANIRSIYRVGTDLFVAGRFSDSLEQVYRFPILMAGDSLGTGVLEYGLNQFPGATNQNAIYAVTVAASGDLFLATDLQDPLLRRSGGQVAAFYPGVFTPLLHAVVWGKGTTLLALRGTGGAGAVSGSSEVLVINTQQQGLP